MITLYILLQINFFCEPFTEVDKDCANEIIQCVTDDVYTLRECHDEYLDDFLNGKKYRGFHE